MTILSAITNLISCAVYPDEDLVPTPSGSLFYELIPVPKGPGVEEIQNIIGLMPPLDIKTGPWIAGGAARRLLRGDSLKGGDIDLFFKDQRSWKKFCKALDDYELIVETKRAKTFRVNGFQVQCINRIFYLSLEEVFKDFDFSVCQIATDGFQIAATKQAQLDIKDDILRLAPNGKAAKHSLVQRMIKYVGHGLTPEPGLFELIIKGGLDYISAYQIFENNDVAIYDEDTGECVEEIIPTDELDASVMRTIARQLGLEVQNV